MHDVLSPLRFHHLLPVDPVRSTTINFTINHHQILAPSFESGFFVAFPATLKKRKCVATLE